MQENDHQHRFRSVKLTNFISFGESMSLVGFIQKIVKVDLIIRFFITFIHDKTDLRIL